MEPDQQGATARVASAGSAVTPAWRQVVDAMPQLVWLADGDGRVWFYNQRVQDYSGPFRGGDGAWRWQPLVHVDDAEATTAAWEEAVATTSPYTCEHRVRMADGSYRWHLSRAVPVRGEDGSITWFGTATDITGRVEQGERLEALAVLSHELNGAGSTGEVAASICRLGRQVIGADFVNVGLVDEHRVALRITMPDVDEDVVRRWSTLPLDGVRTPFNEVLDHGRPVFLDPEQRASRFPDVVEDSDRLGIVTTASVPLAGAGGDVFGVLGCGWHTSVDVDAEVQARLALLADLAGQALERAQRSDVQDRLVHELQDRVLAGHEPAPGLDLAVDYRPAQSSIGFGGDWYDVVGLADGSTAFVVGDVAGHGIAAAAEMATTKATVRTALMASGPADALPLVSRALGHIGSGYVATVAAAWIDLAAGTLEWRLAGHPPPVLRSPGASARLLAGAHHPPIGMPTSARHEDATAFPRGSVLVLYTDGLVERPDVELGDRLEALRRTVDELPAGVGADEARDRLVADLLDDRPTDDVAIVVVVRPG